MESNRNYFERRAGEEGRAAAAATCDAAREAHAELQGMFVELARSGADVSIFLVHSQVGSAGRHDAASLRRELASNSPPRSASLKR